MRNNDDVLTKEVQITTMPYFLSHQYAEILHASEQQLKRLKEQSDKKAQSHGGAGVYKSQFLKDKLEAQN